MATHSSFLAWESLWTEDPGGPVTMKLQRVGYDSRTEQARMHALLSRC